MKPHVGFVLALCKLLQLRTVPKFRSGIAYHLAGMPLESFWVLLSIYCMHY